MHFFAKQFDLSGSNIKAILYNAAYIAAENGRDEKMPLTIHASHLVTAIRMEYAKLGKFLQTGEFGTYAMYLKNI